MSTQPLICKHCGKDTSTVEYDYMHGTDHLACVLEEEIKNSEFDCCVLCGDKTPYRRSTDINRRVGYIEGAGQLCKTCYDEGTERRQIVIPADLVYNTPNDQELGEKIRQLYYATKNNS